jgi:DNA-binding transcriptional LysR family regulator
MGRASLAELEAVATVARTGGFRAAARELGVSSSALSHAIAALEDRLHLRLFNRTTRSVSLTVAGEAFVAEIAPALAAIDGALENAIEGGSEISGLLRINTSRGAAAMLLQPLFLRYLRRYPRVELEIATEEALIDVLGQGFDAGIRLADTVPADMIAESGLMVEAALAGAGLAYIGEASGAEHIAAGRLEVVLADWTPPYPGLSLYFAGRRHIPARLRALIDLIREPTTAAGRTPPRSHRR